jgi:EAL domain-containing protein (putative c-di-GMP-specific phosphodiesterase class I)
VSLRTNEVIRLEALARWQHPAQGLLGPGEFVGLAEQTGLIEPLTMLLIDKVLREWAAPRVYPPIQVAVNLSARHLRDPDLPDRVAEVLRRHCAPPSALALEITENSIMSDPDRSIACLSRLREMGISVAVDDYGTGYSSLSYLRDLPVDELKIDRLFVSGLRTIDAAIVRSTIELAHNLGLNIVAEGVESMGFVITSGRSAAIPLRGPSSRRRRVLRRLGAGSSATHHKASCDARRRARGRSLPAAL